MPRSLANSLYERLLRSFPADQAYTQADWNQDAMTEPVRHFLVQLLRHHKNREARRLRRARTEWVDYDHPEMENAVRTFFAAVENHIQVPRDQWKNTLHQATHQTTAHLIRPVDVLTDFVFGEQTAPLRLQQVLWRMRFFGPFAYHRNAIQAFAQKQDLDALKPDQFERVLRRVDERITADFNADRWLQLLDALFITTRRATGQELVETRLLRSFFVEKDASHIVERLTAYEQDGHEAIGPRALHRLIQDARGTPSEQRTTASSTPPSSPSERRHSAEPPKTSPPPTPSQTPVDPPTDDDIWGVAGAARPVNSEAEPSATDEGTGGEAPLWKQFQQGQHSGDKRADDHRVGDSQQPLWAQYRRDRPTPSTPLQSKVSPSNGSENQPSSKHSPPTSPDPNTDLRTLEREVLGTSNPPHRAVYIRQLFNGDENAYQRVLGRLRSAESWGKASQILASDVFRAHKVNIYSDAAVHFTNAIESRFRG